MRYKWVFTWGGKLIRSQFEGCALNKEKSHQKIKWTRIYREKQMSVIFFLTLVILSWKSGAPSSDINHLFICFYLLSLLTQKDSPQPCRSPICLQDDLVMISVWVVAWLFCNGTTSADLDHDGWVKSGHYSYVTSTFSPVSKRKHSFNHSTFQAHPGQLVLFKDTITDA